MITLRSLFCALTLALSLAGAGQGAANPPAPVAPLSQALPAARADSGAAAAQTPAGERKDLTVFFSVGVVLDLLLVGAFAIWAVRQWRKTR